MMGLKSLFLGLLGLATTAAAEVVPRSTFTQVSSFGSNPSNTTMYLYVPATLAAKPPVVVGIHWCHGTATAYYQGTQWATLSEKYGFIVIYPESPFVAEDGCWDVATKETLTHGGDGDSNSIANMINFVLTQYPADKERVYVTGISSGAMMTNVMAAVYPELFAAGVIYSGVPPGCFMSVDNIPDYWNSTCADGDSIAPQAYWVDSVKAMYPGYSGAYPKLQVYHGDADDVLNFANYGETIKLWAGIFGYDYQTPVQTLANDPVSPFTKHIFGDKLQGIVGAGLPHNVPHDETQDAIWFGLNGAVTPTTTAMTTTTKTTMTTTMGSTSTSTAATTTASGAAASHWEQCGGIGWTGPTNCVSPYTCTYSNDWYSQCL